jgi:coenzyme F420-reducing hydrogenase beta subunit
MSVDCRLCVACGRCVQVCPAGDLPAQKLPDLGASATQLAWAMSDTVRHAASSGGAARMLAAAVVATGMSVYSLKRMSDYPWAEGSFYSDVFNLNDMPNSMYLPVMALKNFKDIPFGPLMLIGTTCQLMAAERLLGTHGDEPMKVAIFCKQQKHLGFTRFTAKRLGLEFDKSMNGDLFYRGQGWPGVSGLFGKTILYEEAAALPFGRRLWRVPGCRACVNPFGYRPDLTLADPWGLEPSGTSGKSLVLVWTQRGQDLLDSAPGLELGRIVSLAEVKQSTGWEDLLWRNELTAYYAGQSKFRSKVLGRLDELKTRAWEALLEGPLLPENVYRLLAHLPDSVSVAREMVDLLETRRNS